MVDSITFGSEITGAEAPAGADAQDRPAWLPENFKTPEDLAKSWADTKAALTQAQQRLAEVDKTATKPDEAGDKKATEEAAKDPAKPDLTIPEENPDEAAKDAVEAAGLDVTVWQEEFNTTGMSPRRVGPRSPRV